MDTYISPLSERYASREMQHIFSPAFKFTTWRRLWVILAECEMELGLDITQQQIDEMKANVHNIDFEKAAEYEKKLRHDVMAHVHAYGDVCPNAKGIIHLGATSCYVGDNTDIIIMQKALALIKSRLLAVAQVLRGFCLEYAGLPMLGFTHFQPAQPTTLGKRATLWLQDTMYDLQELDFVADSIKPLGSKGTTGTQASFRELFDGDYEKAKALDRLIAEKIGFDMAVPVAGQTYSRKMDARVLNVLSQIAQSAAKFSNDIRLLAHLKEVEEPFEKNQIGSSAMAYKRNPMRSERMASLARYVIVNAQNAAFTAAGQWFERTLDDSANKRISIPEGFLACDGILSIYHNVAQGLVVNPRVIQKHLMEELPFMATENILMDCVKRGGDRQELHEAIRLHSIAAGNVVKQEGGANDLVERIAADPVFGMTLSQLQSMMNPEDFTGFATEQTREYISNHVDPILEKYSNTPLAESELHV